MDIVIVLLLIISINSYAYSASIRTIYRQYNKWPNLYDKYNYFKYIKKIHPFLYLFLIPFIVFLYFGFTYWNLFLVIGITLPSYVISNLIADQWIKRHLKILRDKLPWGTDIK